MANPGEEMVCGQCGQTILGKAMKVFVSSSSCMLIIIFTVQVFIFILTFTNCRQEYHLICHRIPSIPILKNHLEINANRLVRSIGTSITSSAATVEWESEETAKWGNYLLQRIKVGKVLSFSVSSSTIIKSSEWGKFFPSRPYPYNQVWQKEGRLYCDSDYKKKFVPRCADCSGFILGVIITITRPISILEFICAIVSLLYCIRPITLLQECIRAVGETWHPEHFSCFVSFSFSLNH